MLTNSVQREVLQDISTEKRLLCHKAYVVKIFLTADSILLMPKREYSKMYHYKVGI